VPPGGKSSAPFAILHLGIQMLRIAAPLPGVIQACRKDTVKRLIITGVSEPGWSPVHRKSPGCQEAHRGF